jgi:hypothetical protein
LKEYASSGEFILNEGAGLDIPAVENGNEDCSLFEVQKELMVWRKI